MSLAVGQEIGGRVTRTYTIAVPDEPASDVLPAIIVFHGGGGDATVVAKRWGVDRSEPVPDDLAGYVLVFPECDSRIGTRWIHLDSDDVGFPTLDLADDRRTAAMDGVMATADKPCRRIS